MENKKIITMEKENARRVLEEKLFIADIKDINITTPHLGKFRDVFKLIKLLGIGAFGVVLEVYNKQTQEYSALKVRNEDNL